ncbi:hypothetical protein [Demequina sp. NBRC 110051]|uniref:FMN-binding protein n=1 Tax=Demequina sp. NBRC 110051 TaxID=1570340 RepID=UPI001180DCC2|nr:hypothetical protein [Demequina sp. NBRC 110051]
MRTQAGVMVVGASAVMLTAGVIAAPDVTGAVGADADPTATGDATGGATDGSQTPDSSATGTDGGTDGGADAGAGVTGTFDGPVVSNLRGDYQASLTFEDGVLVDVTFPVAGTDAPESRFVNEQSLPVLEEEMLAAQDWDVEYISGASYTSPAMVESAQGAFEDAGL